MTLDWHLYFLHQNPYMLTVNSTIPIYLVAFLPVFSGAGRCRGGWHHLRWGAGWDGPEAKSQHPRGAQLGDRGLRGLGMFWWDSGRCFWKMFLEDVSGRCFWIETTGWLESIRIVWCSASGIWDLRWIWRYRYSRQFWRLRWRQSSWGVIPMILVVACCEVIVAGRNLPRSWPSWFDLRLGTPKFIILSMNMAIWGGKSHKFPRSFRIRDLSFVSRGAEVHLWRTHHLVPWRTVLHLLGFRNRSRREMRA